MIVGVKKMKKIIFTILVFALVFCLVGCKTTETTEESFLNELSESKSYKVEGVMETFFENGRRQNEFTVYYKSPDFIKVVLQSVENDDQQIILKNKEGVYVLVPSVNKNFKIQSSWPSNASYPYLLQSLAKDMVNDDQAIKTETDTTYTVQTKTKMHTNADAVSQKIIFSKETNMPIEVLVYDAEGDLFIRCVFTQIELDYNVSDTEFEVGNSLDAAYLKYGDTGLIFAERRFDLPTYCPDGLTLKANVSVKTGDDARVIMQFAGDNTLTIVQELVNYNEKTSTNTEIGEVVMIMGNVLVLNEHNLKFIFEGIEYTIASDQLSQSELLKIASSYMMNENK